jgi:acetyl esterase/lipase
MMTAPAPRLLFLIIAFLLPLASFSARAEAPAGPKPTLTLNLWNGPAPGEPANPEPEQPESYNRLSHVSVPTLDVYLPEPGKTNGTALIYISGGGYRTTFAKVLGSECAKEYVPQGFTVFSVKYRLTPPSVDVRADALADLQRAIRIVRSRAAEWHINPNRIGVFGWSVGGDLILNLCGHPYAGNPQAADLVDRQSCRPDFIGLFACASTSDTLAALSPDLPPAFINHCRDDSVAPYAISEQVAAAWTQAGKPVHLDLYDKGNHAGFNFDGNPIPEWRGKFLAWLREQKMLDAAPSAAHGNP